MNDIIIFEINLEDIYNIEYVDFSLLTYWVLSGNYKFSRTYES